MKKSIFTSFYLLIWTISCGQIKDSAYYKKISDPSTRIIKLNEGYNIFSQVIGTGKIKILFLHGGPGNTHEAFEIFKEQLPLDKYQLIFYDQLGSYYSDRPNDTTVWNIPRFVDEVEQVRQYYQLDNFYLFGHSWGGLLAMEYALKYPSKLKGLIISNKSYSQKNLVATRNEITIKIAKDSNCSKQTIDELKNNELLSDTLDDDKIQKGFMRGYTIRMDSLPNAMKNYMQHITIGRFIRYMKDRTNWNIYDRLRYINTPTLLIGGRHDFVKVSELMQMQKQIKNSKLYICPNGGHFDYWDDTKNYFKAFRQFVEQSKTSKLPLTKGLPQGWRTK